MLVTGCVERSDSPSVTMQYSLEDILNHTMPMGDNPLISKAYDIAEDAHEGQSYGDSSYYYGHILTVVETFEGMAVLFGLDDDSLVIGTCIAILHDVLEDTDYTSEQLIEELILKDTIEFKLLAELIVLGVQVLTHSTSDPYNSYVQKIVAAGELELMLVKLADLQTNILSVGTHPDPTFKERKLPIYKEAVKTLTRAIVEVL